MHHDDAVNLRLQRKRMKTKEIIAFEFRARRIESSYPRVLSSRI
jgi:hypothetical protein